MNTLARVVTWLTTHERPWSAVTRRRARYLRSQCCAAPIVQCRELDTNLLPALCGRCGAELGAPGYEDCDPQPVTPYDQWGCAGRHRGIGTDDCPRETHHHHDRRCAPPMVVQAEERVRGGGEESGSIRDRAQARSRW